ncbi:hypothetical protein B0T17DRAFT_463029, partial [Bombardia bombarda]
MGDNTGVGPGPGPTRLPRPLTAADLHLQLEKEQEAVVNRLSRELSLLRAQQNSSVVSNTSSTSASVSGAESAHISDTQHVITGPGLSQHRAGIHHRTSSNTSARSFTATNIPPAVSTASLAGISSPAPVRPGQPQAAALGGISLSRQNSSTSHRSRTGSPSPAPSGRIPSSHPSQSHTPLQSWIQPPHLSPHLATASTNSSVVATPGSGTTASVVSDMASSSSPAMLPATSRYEETAFYRAELDNVKRENEALKRRVRELERLVPSAPLPVAAAVLPLRVVSLRVLARQRQLRRQLRQQAVVERPRVLSHWSTAGSVGVGVPEDEVRVGESAASAGLGRQQQREQEQE